MTPVRAFALCAAFATFLPSGMVAQDFGPDGADIDIRGVSGTEVIAVDLQGRSFACIMEQGSGRMVMTDCLPLVHVSAADAAARAAAQEAAVEAILNLPPVMGAAAMERALRDLGCELRVPDDDDDAALLTLAIAMAPHMSLDPDLMEGPMMDAMGELVEDAARLLVAEDRIVISQGRGVVTVPGC